MTSVHCIEAGTDKLAYFEYIDGRQERITPSVRDT